VTVSVNGGSMVDVNYAEKFLVERNIKDHRFGSGEGMGENVRDREGTCKVSFNVSSNTDGRWVSERGKKTFPHIIISGTGDIKTKGVRIGPSNLDSADPWFLDN